MHHNRAWFEVAVRGVLTLCLSLALCIDMKIQSLVGSQLLNKAELFWHVMGLTGKGLLITVLFFLLLWVNGRIDEKIIERRVAFLITNGFIGLVWLMGEGFRVDNTLWTLRASYVQMLKSLIYFVGITYGLNQITCFLYYALEKKERKNREKCALAEQGGRSSGIVKAYQEHTAAVSFGAIFALWLPHLIFAYPANVCIDASGQLAQFFGAIAYSGHHPITSTLLMGGLVKAGSLISDNFGLFLYITVQTITGAWVLAYTLHLMRELNTPVWLRVLTFFCYVSVPYYTNYIGVILKDVPYTYAVLLFVVELIYLFIQREGYFRSKRHILLLAVSIAGTILLRNNGRYVIYPTIAATLLRFFLGKRKSEKSFGERRRILRLTAAVLLIPALLSEVFEASIMNILHVESGSIREALSLPMQQTARYVKEFGDEVTEEEKTIISAVLDYENLAENYDPMTSDPVKSTFVFRPTTEELRNYFSVWLKQFAKHPLIYFEATANQNYGLLYPKANNIDIYVQYRPSILSETIHMDIDNETFANLADLLRAFYIMGFYFPGLNILSHPAFYVTLLIWLTLFALYKKRWLWLLTSIPLWLTAVIAVLSPVIQENSRYVFPIIYAMPVISAYYIYLGRNEESQDKRVAAANHPSS